MNDAPFNLKKRNIAFENSVFNVFSDQLTDGEVTLVPDYLVVEPKNKNENGITGVAIVPVKDGKIGLVKIYRHAISEYAWEVPRGFIDKNEVAEVAALRELKEETGLLCDRNRLKRLGVICPEPGVISAKINIYIASIDNEDCYKNADELGHVEFKWFTHKQSTEIAQDELILDSTTLVACALSGYL